jgi:hypothetical protein
MPVQLLPTAPAQLLDVPARGLQRKPGLLQRGPRFIDHFVVVQQSKQQVLAADEVVMQKPGFLLRVDDDPASAISEALEHESKLRAREQSRWSAPS